MKLQHTAQDPFSRAEDFHKGPYGVLNLRKKSLHSLSPPRFDGTHEPAGFGGELLGLGEETSCRCFFYHRTSDSRGLRV